MTDIAPERKNIAEFKWRQVLSIGLLLSFIILGLYYYWFVVANRYVIFLYTHLGAGPFDGLTNGRYWMAGFVACGIVMLLYAVLNWYLARIAGLRYQTYHPPPWWHIWSFCLIPNSVGIFIITMPLGRPPLTTNLMLALCFTTALGLAFALQPGMLIVKRPSELIWLSVASVGLMPALLLLRAVELPSRGLAGSTYAFVLGIIAPIAGLIWLILLSWAHAKYTKQNWTVVQLLIAGFCFCYLLLPVVHHIFFTPPNGRYITTSGNFFAEGSAIQLGSIFVAVISAIIAVQIGKRVSYL